MLQPFHARSLEVATSQGLQKDSILAVVKLQELQDLSQLGDLLEECYLAGTEGKKPPPSANLKPRRVDDPAGSGSGSPASGIPCRHAPAQQLFDSGFNHHFSHGHIAKPGLLFVDDLDGSHLPGMFFLNINPRNI